MCLPAWCIVQCISPMAYPRAYPFWLKISGEMYGQGSQRRFPPSLDSLRHVESGITGAHE